MQKVTAETPNSATNVLPLNKPVVIYDKKMTLWLIFLGGRTRNSVCAISLEKLLLFVINTSPAPSLMV